MPPNAKPYGLNLWKNVIYTTSAQGCGGNPNYVYAFDLATRRTAHLFGQRRYVGAHGSIDRQGRIDLHRHGRRFVQPRAALVRNGGHCREAGSQEQALKLSDYYGPPNAEYLLKRDIDLQVTGPVFDHEGREWLVQGSKECRTWLLDTSALGGEDHSTAEHRSPLICNEDQDYQAAGIYGAMASYEDAKGTRWVLVPFWGPKHPKFKAPIEHGEVFNGAVAAFKMERDRGRALQPEPGVDLRDMKHADPPVIANDIVFGFASGEDVVLRNPPMPFGGEPDPGGTDGRISRSSHSVSVTRSTGRPDRSCGRAAIRSPRGIITAAFRSRTGACTSRPTTAPSIASGSPNEDADTRSLRARVCGGDGRSHTRSGAQRSGLDDAGVRCAAHLVDARGSGTCRPRVSRSSSWCGS